MENPIKMDDLGVPPMLFRVCFPRVVALTSAVEVPEAGAAVETVNEEWDGDKGSGDGGDICRFICAWWRSYIEGNMFDVWFFVRFNFFQFFFN